MASYAGGTGTVIGGVDTKIPFPNKYGDLADAPGILEDRSLAIYNLIKDAVAGGIAGIPPPPKVGVDEFKVLFDQFIVADSHRLESTDSKVTIPVATTAVPNGISVGLSITAPAWDSVAIVTVYVNVDGATAAGDVKATLKADTTVIAYNEMYISTSLGGDMHQFTTVQNVPSGAKLTCEVVRAGVTGGQVGTRFMNAVFLRLGTKVARAAANP